MPKPKTPKTLSAKKKKPKAETVCISRPNGFWGANTSPLLKLPETENDFLEAADEYEQQGGKHRAGYFPS